MLELAQRQELQPYLVCQESHSLLDSRLEELEVSGYFLECCDRKHLPTSSMNSPAQPAHYIGLVLYPRARVSCYLLGSIL